LSRNSSSDKTVPTYRVVYEPAGICSHCPADKTILTDTATLGLALRSDCGGKGRCGQCKVIVSANESVPEPSIEEQKLLTEQELRYGYRLACALQPQGPLRVTIPETSLDSKETGSKNNLTGTFKPDPLIKRQVILSTDKQFPADQNSDLACRVPKGQIPAGWNSDLSFSALIQLSRLSSENDFTFIAHQHLGVTSILPGNQPLSLGMAFDLGTTTLAAYLCNFSDGSILASASAANPQRRFGEDVVSRIAYAQENEHGTETMKDLVVEAMNRLINQCLERTKCSVGSIDEICVVGNPTMQHLCLGLNPDSLGSYPYRPVFRQSLDVRSEDLGLCTRSDVNVHVFPVISGFIGGDTIAAVLADEVHQRKAVTLLIDIGTNGELVLGNSERLWTTSCATGPALEGAHISCGMRATSGAIDRIVIDPTTYQPDLHVIGSENEGTLPIGLCGSGIIDVIAELVKTGIILPNGRLREGLPGVLQDNDGIGKGFLLWESNQTKELRQIVLSLSDIRQVQLAKAALSAGIQLLMRRSGCDHFDRIVLTGAFGARFNWKNAILIGMLPELAEDVSVEIMENGAGHGAVKALLSIEQREEKDRLANSMSFLDLASDADFTEIFTSSTIFSQAVP